MTDAEHNVNTNKKASQKRSLLFKALFLLIALALIAYFLYYYLSLRWYESTDNAYVNANIVQITPQIAGIVIAIDADDGDFVKAGQPLVRLDPVDAEVVLNQARAKLARTVRQVRGLYSQASGAHAGAQVRQAQVEAQEAAVKVAKTALDTARSDFNRRQKLRASGAISDEESIHAANVYAQAQSQYQSALSQLDASRQQLIETAEQAKVSKVLVDNTTLEKHPDILAAAADLKAAYLNSVRSVLVSPVDGYVAKRSVQVGQRINAGSTLIAVIPLDKAWVTANYKETQMRKMRIGQKVKITSDLYGEDVVYDGVITSLGIGTGSAFALLPAQNATGNWIKIVQRIPVRVSFVNPEQLRQHPLRVGMSMKVTTNLHDDTGPVLSDGVNQANIQETSIYDQQVVAAQKLVEDIIRENSGTQPTPLTDAGFTQGQ